MCALMPLLESSALVAAKEDGGRGTETPPLSGGRGGASGRSSVILPFTREPVALETLLFASCTRAISRSRLLGRFGASTGGKNPLSTLSPTAERVAVEELAKLVDVDVVPGTDVLGIETS